MKLRLPSSAHDPIVFSCANPVPEIWPWEAKDAGARIVATGRSDFPNQVNNSLGFPGIFCGTLDVRARTLLHPDYQPDLDIVVEAPDGRLIAFCICWFDEGSRVGRVEPLGCHQDFRRKALGRVALSEGLHRLQSLGAQNIFVETDLFRNTALRLYESFDFQVIQEVLVYRKDYGEVEW